MARKRMVTRTIKTREVAVLCLNTETAEPHNEVFIVPQNIGEGEKTVNYLRKKYDTDTEKVVSIVGTKEVEQLYGMPEEDFVKLAKPINKDEADTQPTD